MKRLSALVAMMRAKAAPSLPALVLTKRFSPLVLSRFGAETVSLPCLYRVGDHVCLRGDAKHPIMTVIGVQPSMFEQGPQEVLCQWRGRGGKGRRWRERYFKPGNLHRVCGLVEARQ